jgi:hypothetical protein
MTPGTRALLLNSGIKLSKIYAVATGFALLGNLATRDGQQIIHDKNYSTTEKIGAYALDSALMPAQVFGGLLSGCAQEVGKDRSAPSHPSGGSGLRP